MKKDPLSNKAPEKPVHDVASGNALLSSETILRTNKRGMAKGGPFSLHMGESGNPCMYAVKLSIAKKLRSLSFWFSV